MRELVIDLEKPYGLLAACIGFFGLGAWVLLDRASTNDRGLIINGLIHLEPGSADVFYAVLGFFSLAFVVLAIKAGFELAMRPKFQVTLDGERIVFPDPMIIRGGADRTVHYEDIVAVHVGNAGGRQRSIQITTSGRKHFINSRFLPAQWLVDVLARELANRLQAFRASEVSERC